ncbi:MAG: hypothetical protein ABI986_00815 [Chloroflexota bacterium]
MNHLPFEDWLLNEMPVTPEQQRDLDLHLRACTTCSALAETGRMLSTSKMVAPVPGFTMRFQNRLAEHKVAERRRKLWGALLFTLTGLALLMWAVGPYLASFLASPATWISIVVGWLVFIGTTLSALLDAGNVMLRVFPKFVSPFMWLILFSTLAGVGLLFSVSIWRFVRVPQGV